MHIIFYLIGIVVHEPSAFCSKSIYRICNGTIIMIGLLLLHFGRFCQDMIHHSLNISVDITDIIIIMTMMLTLITDA